ncbi:MAG TPA: sigma-70 family RNA polymerase sigma factor [Spirochaetota bacterium]|nr:sigma-70 family RNA polymerase sigma factor [Spirochaetota bacterium]HPI89945.1 sigma-70 family RNA polymerase sigma factor [Spirochaetota bacterium]HPR48456.1 sigma-70 family RNA polymerase sigma factor [Spirochaetota bacterium]
MLRRNRIFARAYSEYYSLVFSMVFSRINNVEDTEDICQDVFASLYHKLDSIVDIKKWLYGAARFEVMSFYRRKRIHLPLEEEALDELMQYNNSSGEVMMIINDAIENADNYSSDRERILFNLIAFRNFSYEEAAKHTGYTRRQARYRYTLIVKRITSHLAGKGIKNLEDLL